MKRMETTNTSFQEKKKMELKNLGSDLIRQL